MCDHRYNKNMDNEFADYPGVEVQPQDKPEEWRVGGEPTIGESRVAAWRVADALDHGETPEEVAYNYSLALKAVVDFKAYRDAHQPALKP